MFRSRYWLLPGLIVIALIAGLQFHRLQTELASAPPARTIAFTGAAACQDCHTDRHESWSRTWHRTMTQEADPKAIQGRFDGTELRGFGGVVKPGSDGARYWFDYQDPDTGANLGRVEVARLVGSHRYQQYLARDPQSQTYFRLHYLWHKADQRWVHMNAVFLGDDRQDFDAQSAIWNANCLFCHNTGPVPKINNLEQLRARAQAGEALNVQREMRFDTEVAELGISCESCHGPGGEHVQRMQRTSLRWLARFADVADASIVQPTDLEAHRSNSVCGACHAGRSPKSTEALTQIYQQGYGFRPGDALEEHFTVLQRDTPSPSPAVPDLYSNRFWADGSPRLTAYEYQGQNASKCASDPRLTCLRCHTMHSGNPDAMLPDDGRSGSSCLRCHQSLRGQAARHSGHAEGSAGADCMSCHMPRAVYGVMTIHRTHQIAVPDVGADLQAGKPNACLNCHAEQTPVWALEQLQRLWPNHPFATDLQRLDSAPLVLADGLSGLLAGDPVRQAVTAFELGRTEQATSPSALLPRVPWLLIAMADDRPAIRRFSQQSLQAIDQALAGSTFALGLAQDLNAFDFTGPPEQRAAVLQRLRELFAALDKSAWPPPPPATALDGAYRLDPGTLAELLQLGAMDNKQIDVGE